MSPFFLIAHVGVHTQGYDLFCGGVESEGHLIAGLGVIPEDQIHEASS
jgi:hypothetical protein